MKSFKYILFLVVSLFAIFASNVYADNALEVKEINLEAPTLAKNPKLEAQMNRLASELRCTVCQNESLATSRAGLAGDLRRELREQIEIGKSDDEIKNFMVERYGEFVLYRPRFKLATLFLWLGPFILVVLGVIILIYYMKSRNRKLAKNQNNVENDDLTDNPNQAKQTLDKLDKLLQD